MPTRLIREGINSSDRIDQLDWPAEVFYRRLLNKVDDYGLYDARPTFLRSTLYPTKADRVREADCSRWLDECQAAGLILLYEAATEQSSSVKPYLKVLDTRWKTRSEPKYPLPTDSNCKQLQTVAPVVRSRSRCTNSLEKPMSGKPDAAPETRGKFNGHKAEALEILTFLNETAGKAFRPVESNVEVIVARLNEGYTVADMRKVVVRKCSQWKGDETMDTYLRPETLFGKKKMASYTGELVAPKP